MDNRRANSSGCMGFVGAAAFSVLWSIVANQVDWPPETKVYTWPITCALIVAIAGYGLSRFVANRYPALQLRLQNIAAYTFLYRRWMHPLRRLRVLVIGPDDHEPTARLVSILSDAGRWKVARRWLPRDIPEGRYDVVVAASVTDEWWKEQPRRDWEALISAFVRDGGGFVAIHDATSLWSFAGRFENKDGRIVHHRSITEELLGLEPRMQFLADWGPRTPAGEVVDGPSQLVYYVAPQRLPIRVVDPTLEPNLWLADFVLDDEILPYNTVPEVVPFLTTVVRDTEPSAVPFWNSEFVVSGGMPVGKGRTAFCVLGHNMNTYDSESFKTHLVNLVKWCGERSRGNQRLR